MSDNQLDFALIRRTSIKGVRDCGISCHGT
jgi:hypothetical protein